MEATVTTSGRTVELRVTHDDGRPAAGAAVRILHARQTAVVVARTDGRGRWASADLRPGSYEALIEAGDASLQLPFTIVDAGPTGRGGWMGGVLGVLCLGGAGLVLVAGRPRFGNRVPAALLVACGAGFLGWSAIAGGLTTTADDPDVAAAARAFLQARDVRPLSEPLERLLTDAKPVPTEPHPLVGQPAPAFELTDAHDGRRRLTDALARGPVVLVFYYGYHCNHCVGQLFALHADVAKFRELGAEVIAVSADPPEWTRDRFQKYGPFAFPVLTDPGNAVAQAYGVYRPACCGAGEELRHGTFVIGRDGKIVWAQTGDEPFTDNCTLLVEIARLEGRRPAASLK